MPRLCWGLRPEGALRGLEAEGISPVVFRGTSTELAWDGRFGAATGRATLSFDPAERLEQIALVLPAAGTGEATFERWSARLSAQQASQPRERAGPEDRLRIWTVGRDPGQEPVASLRWLPRSEPPILEVRWLRPHRSSRSCPW